MKLYYPQSHYNKNYRRLVFPLLKPFIKKGNFTDLQRMALYGVSEKDFDFSEVLEESDFAILTMAWNYYILTDQESVAIDFVKKCEAVNKKVITFNAGDFGVKIPFFKNLIILRPSGYKSNFTTNEFSLPAFIEDPLLKYFNSNDVIQRPYLPKPVIGFCGQANPSLFNAVKEKSSTLLRNIKSSIRISKNETQQLLSTSFLRAKILSSLGKSQNLETNFILRKKYRAGITADKKTHPTTVEFYDNLRDSDYVVCIRGAGNFSVRFYETLAMGRIPIFINTDCALPLEKNIDWKKHAVWVDIKERGQVANKVKDFHNALSSKDFLDLQLANRSLWKDKLTLGGFFKNFKM